VYNGGVRFPDHSPEGTGVVVNAYQRGLKLREIQDGLSQTAVMSERLVTNIGKPYESKEALHRETGRYLWYTATSHTGKHEERLAAQACRDRRTTPVPYASAPTSYQFAFSLPNGYTHLIGPNHPACYNAVDRYDYVYGYQLVPPSSRHAGGVHLLMADGQVRFVSDSIGDAPWRAAGTRAGGESERLPP